MKKFLGYIAAIILSLTSLASVAQEKQEVVEIPVVLLDSIVDELVVKDHLVYKLNVQDSIISVYQQIGQNMYMQIEIHKLREQEYEKILYSLQQQMLIIEAEKKDLQTSKQKQKMKSLFTQFGQAIVIVILATLLISD